MPRSVLTLTSFGWIFSAASYQPEASWKRPASKYMFPSSTRATASAGFCWAVVFKADARDSSRAGAWALAVPPGAWLDAPDAAGGGTGRPPPLHAPLVQPTDT